MTLDLIIHGGYVITMEGPGTGIINRGAVGIKGNKIVAVGEEQDVTSRYTAHRYIAAKGKAVMPGFVLRASCPSLGWPGTRILPPLPV